jgi:hypothetical protein
MTILEEKRYQPTSIDDLRRYTRIESCEPPYPVEYDDLTDQAALKILMGKVGQDYKVDYHLYSAQADILDEDLYVRNEEIENGITAWDLNNIQLDYAGEQFLQRQKEYENIEDSSMREKIQGRMDHLKEVIINLGDWFVEDGNIPEAYYTISNRFNTAISKDREEVSPKKYPWLELESLKWENIILEFTSNDTIRVDIRGIKGSVYNYTQFGFNKIRNPHKKILTWKLLNIFAESGGSLIPQNRAKTEKSVSDLRKHLQKIFGIKGNPIHWKREERAWETNFIIRPNKNLISEISDDLDEEN